MATKPKAVYDHRVHMLVVGDTGVGKTHMLRQFNVDPYVEHYPIENIDHIVRTVNVGGRSVQLRVWDSYGRDSHRETSESYYRGAHAFIVIYDISDWTSFEKIRAYFLRTISRLANLIATNSIVLIGSKSEIDREAKRQVTREEGQQLADELRCPFYEASAKDNINVTEAFMAAAEIGLLTKIMMFSTPIRLRGDTDDCFKGHNLQKCTFAALPDDDCRFCSVCRAVVANGSAGAQCQACGFYLCPTCLPAKTVERDLEKAFIEICDSADAGVPDGQFARGMCLANGDVTKQDLEEAAKWLKRAADQGHAYAQVALGKIVNFSTPGCLRGKTDHCFKGHNLQKCTFAALPDDDCRFCSVCRAVITNGSAGAQCQACGFYLCPTCLPAKAVERDLEKAFSEICLSSENNNPDGHFSRGMCLANGDVTKQDLEEAAKWLKRAADQGHAHAQFVLGTCYARGRGVKKSHSNALAWFVRAADQQHAAAQSKLQTMKVTELHLSAFRGSLDSVKALLVRHGFLQPDAGLDETDMYLRRPLHMAAANGHVYVLQALLAAGADIEATDKWQRTPVVLAAANGHADVVQSLIQERAAIDVKDKWSSSPLHLAAGGGHVDVVKALLFAKSNIEAENGSLETPLHCAVLNSHIEVVHVLLEQTLVNAHVLRSRHYTPLHLAAEIGNADIVNALLFAGADVLATNCPRNVGVPDLGEGSSLPVQRFTPLKPVSARLRSDKMKSYELFVTEVRPSTGGQPVVMFAYYPTDTLKRRAVPLAEVFRAQIEKFEDKECCLHLFFTQDPHELVFVLDSEVQARDLKKYLHDQLLLVKKFPDSVCEGILKKWRHNKRRVDFRWFILENSQLYYFTSFTDSKSSDKEINIGDITFVGDVELEDELFSFDVRTLQCTWTLSAADEEDRRRWIQGIRMSMRIEKEGRQFCWDQVTPLHVAALNGHASAVDALLEHGADISAVNKNNDTPLHFAALGGNSFVIKAMLAANADIGARDVSGRTPLCNLAYSKQDAESCITVLLDAGADVAAVDNLVQTPLHQFAVRGIANEVQALLDARADVTSKTNDGKTPVKMAASSDVKRVFEEYKPDPRIELRLKEISDHKQEPPELLDLHELPSLCWILNTLKEYTGSGAGFSPSPSIARIRTLSIAANNIKPIGAIAVARHLQCLNALTCFDMSDNPDLSTAGIMCLLEAMPISIESLGVCNTGLDNSRVGQRLSQFTALSNLDISNNSKLSLAGICSLLQQLPASLNFLRVRNLDLNGGCERVSQELLECFLRFQDLTGFDISENSRLSSSDICSILHTLPASLKSLFISNIDLNSERMSAIESTLQRFKGLEHLNISSNDSNDDSFDPIVESCCRYLPGLKVLDVSHVPSLFSLPDNLLDLKSLNNIIVHGCKNLEFPPLRICQQGTVKIKEYLDGAKNAEPLKKCKVVFLGNGRSGKTSLLRALAKLPLNAEESSTKGVSATHEFSDKLQPDFLRRMSGAPELHFWDFAGQLEYSAAHEFFMSNRQAVYVIIFSVVDDREAQAHQVTYWLRTVLTRDVSCVRVVVVGTKLDKIEPHRLIQELGDIERLMQRVVKSVIQNVAPSCSWSASVKFVTSNSTSPSIFDFESRRVDLKGHIFDLSMEIFKGYHRMMRFPKEYKDISEDIKQVSKKLEKKRLMPLFELSDQKVVTTEYKHLYGAHTNSMKQEALKILGDVGELIYYEVKGSPWICAQPQLIASAIALFADPSRRIESIVSRDDIFAILGDFSRDELTRQKLFDFLLALKVVIRASESVSLSLGLVSAEAPAGTGDAQYLIPLAFKGRPSFWSEVIDVNEMRALRGVRFTSQRMISVASFVRVMSSMCSRPQHMWGCAFFSRVNDAASVFVRLADSRSAVDCIVLGSPNELSSGEIDSCLRSIAVQLGCDGRLPTFLCPLCCQSDIFLRSGNAHVFDFASASASANLSMHILLNCSRYHSPSVEAVKHGVSVNMTSTAAAALTEDALRNQLPWAEVHTGAGIVLGRRLELRVASASEAGVQRISSTVRDNEPFCDAVVDPDVPNADADPEAAGSSSTPQIMPEFCGRLLPNSFFVLTQQLREDDVLEEASLQRLLDVVSDGTCPVKDLGGCVLRRGRGADADVEEVSLKIRYNVSDAICGNQIDMILSLSRASTVQMAEDMDAGMLSVTTATPHQLTTGSLVLLSASANDGGGVLCRVTAVVSDIVLNLVRAENGNHQPPRCVGASLLPCESSFGPNDNVLVMYKEQVGKKAKFDLFPGRSEGLELAEFTPADCSTSAVAACWRDVQNHWELMLGTEFKNYEMTRVTMFRNRSREQLFFRELHTLEVSAASRSCEAEWPVVADTTSVEKEKRRQLQAQTMGHFNEFSEKFGLLPKHENKDVNFSIAWWGKWPSAYFTNAQHGFFNLPSHLKLDPGYFGEGFYLTQYPRYSDYYISGCSLSSRKMQDGHILLCYAALGRPYPVTQDPFDPPRSGTILPSSLCGKLCGPQCGGASSHDCHYATVKMHSDAKEFYPCPLRQQPDFDEIVLFKSERILPVAFVSYQRRRKTLLWLDDRPDKEDNLRIRSKIPGVQWFDEIEVMEQKGVTVKPGVTDRDDGVAAVRISGATGHYASHVNGIFTPTRETHCRRPVYLKGDSKEDRAACMWIEYDDTRQQWQVKDTAHRGNGGWALASISTSSTLEESNKSGSFWKVAYAPVDHHAERISYKLNEAATDKKLNSCPLARENQVDLTLFTSVAAMAAFLLDGAQSKFAKYPSSLFRIICNRRLFLGTVPVFCCSKSEFLCDGISALLSPDDEVVFEGDGLFGGVEAGVTYYLAAVRRSANKEFFSVSRAKGGDRVELQPRALQEQDEAARRPPMSVRASHRSLLHILETSDAWQLSFPATCVFHGSAGGDELRALRGRRPNFVATSSEADCGAFVAFEPVLALQERA